MLSLIAFNFPLEYAIRKVEETQNRMRHN